MTIKPLFLKLKTTDGDQVALNLGLIVLAKPCPTEEHPNATLLFALNDENPWHVQEDLSELLEKIARFDEVRIEGLRHG